MKFWNAHDLMIVDFREKIMLLTDEFEKKFGKDIENYNKRLDLYLKKKLGNQADFILKTSVLMTAKPLILQNRNI